MGEVQMRDGGFASEAVSVYCRPIRVEEGRG
jgi:hypothetical protein